MEPLRALLAEAVISLRPRLGDGGAHRFGCGKLDTNCHPLVSCRRFWVCLYVFTLVHDVVGGQRQAVGGE